MTMLTMKPEQALEQWGLTSTLGLLTQLREDDPLRLRTEEAVDCVAEWLSEGTSSRDTIRGLCIVVGLRAQWALEAGARCA